MRVGILGSGNVAQTLGNGFLSRGHEVMLGTRDPQKLAEWKTEAGERASVGSFADAARFGEIVALATLGTATIEVLQGVGADAFAGKVVMDATNPLGHDDGGLHLTVGFSDSLGEQVQRALPGAHVVKVYNSVGAGLMVDPQLPGGPPDMFVAGNDEGAKRVVETIVHGFGWNVIDAGTIEKSRLLEPLCVLWVDYGMRTGTWSHAYKLLRAT